MNEQTKAFLEELTTLSKRTGIAIDSCGDCHSMWLVDVEKGAPGETMLDGVRFDYVTRRYAEDA